MANRFCVLKKKNEYTLKSVSVSGRLFDNSRNKALTALNFFTQHHRTNVSVEFEDGPNSFRIFWFSIGNTLISIDFSMKNEVSRIFSKNIESDALFHADSESEITLVQISFQTRDIQHTTCKNDRF